jgi:hypothetical protein
MCILYYFLECDALLAARMIHDIIGKGGARQQVDTRLSSRRMMGELTSDGAGPSNSATAQLMVCCLNAISYHDFA